MPITKPRYRREPADLRQRALVEAALRVIARDGADKATVRAISAEAGVSFSLIRHHFAGKDDLLRIAFEHHMHRMTSASVAAADLHTGAREKLGGFVRASLTPPVMTAEAVKIWAGFLQLVPHDARMRGAHLETYHAYRSALERLIDGFLTAEGRSLPPGELHRLAVACNAVIDGLWVEGAMLPQKLPGDEVIRVAMESISAILDVDPAVLA